MTEDELNATFYADYNGPLSEEIIKYYIKRGALVFAVRAAHKYYKCQSIPDAVDVITKMKEDIEKDG